MHRRSPAKTEYSEAQAEALVQRMRHEGILHITEDRTRRGRDPIAPHLAHRDLRTPDRLGADGTKRAQDRSAGNEPRRGSPIAGMNREGGAVRRTFDVFRARG